MSSLLDIFRKGIIIYVKFALQEWKMNAKETRNDDRLKRLALAAILIFAIIVAIGLMLGYVEYFALGGLVLAMLFASPASKRIHLMEFRAGAIIPFVVSVILVLALLLVSLVLKVSINTPPWSVALGLLPLPALIAAVVFLARAISKLDDLQRRIQTEGLALGFGIFLVILTGYAWLTLFGAPQIDWIFAPLVMILCWVAGKLATTVRFQ
jgi:MFS family permease